MIITSTKIAVPKWKRHSILQNKFDSDSNNIVYLDANFKDFNWLASNGGLGQ